MFLKCLSIKADLFKQLLASYNILHLVVRGQSMFPHLSDGDMVSLRKSVRFRKGSMYLFLNPKTGRQVCHRMIGSHQDCLIMKGDNEHCTQNVPEHLVLGACARSELSAVEFAGKYPHLNRACMPEFMFDKISKDEYWLCHAWTRSEITADTALLRRYVGDLDSHPCSRSATTLRLRVDQCAYRIHGDWVFSAYYDDVNQEIRFRCLHDPDWSKHGIATISELAEMQTPRPNFYKRQMQYLGMFA